MKRCFRVFLLSFLLPISTSTWGAIPVQAVDLSCEYLIDPLGIDVTQPRMGWKLEVPGNRLPGESQTAYHILVSSSPELLGKARGDLWDTGWVSSDCSQLIAYQGRPLQTGQLCWWKVRVKTARGKQSGWSKPARWTMGLLKPSDWVAKWIGTDMQFVRTNENPLPDPLFRKSFTLAATPPHAFMHVASVGYHELFINGHKVSDAVLAPCVSDLTKRARYVTYEISEFLRKGTNTIGIALGFSWSVFPSFKTKDKPQSPIVIAQADIHLQGGERMRVSTDDSWRWTGGPTFLDGYWDFMNFGGERYESARELPGWSEPGFDDSGWKPVKAFQPNLILSAQKVEPNRLAMEFVPASIEEVGSNVWRIDMGVNFTGWVGVNLAGQPGDRVEFRWSERADQDMTHKHRSVYVVGPTGKGTFRNRFNYQCGRWITILGLRRKPEITDIRGWLIRTDYKPAAEFSCSNDLLNRICKATTWTYENLTLGGYVVDCAQRERMGYGGDAHATTATGLDFFKTAALYGKWAEDWRDVQGKDPKEPGNLPYTAPTYWGGGGPGWSGYCVTLPWEMFTRLGDQRILEEMFPTIERWLAFLETKSSGNLLRRWGGEWDFLGDWLWPGAKGVNGDSRETLFFNNCYWVYNLQTATKIAEAINQKEKAVSWRARARQIRGTIHREFFNASDNSYANGFQAYLAIALLTEIPPAELREAVASRLQHEIMNVRKGHFWGGITGGSFIIKYLIEANRPDLMFTMATRPDYPGWGDMLHKGATTLWEDWEGKLSLSHSSYLHIGAWFMEGLGGIRPGPDGTGYKHFLLRPGVWNGCPLEWVKCRFDSPYGLIRSDWTHGEGGTTYTLLVPANTTATACLFAGDRQLTAAGKPLRKVKGVRETGRLEGCVVLELEPGEYVFEAR